MPRYRLDYQEPYGYDDNDSQSPGHDVCWTSESKIFDVKDDEAAKYNAQEFLSKEFKIDGEICKRRLVDLVEVNPERPIA